MDGREIKKILKRYYPKATFRVKVSRNRFDKAIDIYTDLLRYTFEVASRHRDLELKLQSDGLQGKEAEEYEFLEQLKKEDEELRRNIEKILQKHGIEEVIYRDERTDEILSGCNVFIFIRPLQA
ncbi:MAG: hypothetical protein JHC30_04010 [Caldisericum sp.]|jgi:transposase|nr:hypothetical protein [Caldisericum sp.]